MEKSNHLRFRELWEYWPKFLLGSGSICGLGASAFPSASFQLIGIELAWRWAFTALAVGFIVIGAIGEWRRTKSLKQLEQKAHRATTLFENYRLEVTVVLERVLLYLADDCGLTKDEACKPAVRLTVYSYRENSKSFLPLVRISGNPEWKLLRHFDYPAYSGALWRCWEQGSFFVRTNKVGSEWVRQMVDDFGPTEKVAQEIRMQSKKIWLIRLEHPDSGPFGVLAVESIDGTVTGNTTEDLKSSKYFTFMCSLLRLIRKSHMEGFIEDEKTTGEID